MTAVRIAGLPPPRPEPGARVTVAFRLPHQDGPVVLSGRARSAEGALEVGIDRIEGAGRDAYERHLLAWTGALVRERQATALATSASLSPITDHRRILGLFTESLAARSDVLIGGGLDEPLRTLLAAVAPDEVVLDLAADARRAPLPGTTVRGSLLSPNGPYSFETRVRARQGGELRLLLPDLLHQHEKRAERRTPAATTGAADRIRIALPDVYGGVLERPLLDVSDVGAAFLTEPGDPFFLPGTPLREVVLVRGDVAGPPRTAEVRQVAAYPGSAAARLRIGIALDVVRMRPPSGSRRGDERGRALDRLALVGRWSLSVARSRLSWRRDQQAPGPLVNVVRYHTPAGKEIVALVNATRPIGQSGRRLRGPLIVIPPAFGKTKETYTTLAVVLADTFRREGRECVIVRYDDVDSVGESYKEPGDWPDSRQMMRYTLSQSTEDLLATLDYFHGRPWFWPTHTVILSFSLAALAARRAILSDAFARVTHWFSVMGAVDVQDVFLNATGGVDLIGGHQVGHRFGVMPVLGHLGDVDRFAEDAIALGLATLRDARRDLARIRVPVTWFVGRDDRWVRPERVHDVMTVSAPAPREVIELPLGHTLPRNADALAAFETTLGALWRQLYDAPLPGVAFDLAKVRRLTSLERERVPESRLGDVREYWERYLLGEDGRGLGFDLWSSTPAYRELLDLQRQLLDVSEGDVVADLGAGTGNFVEHLLTRLARDGFRTSPRRLLVADLVPAALERARAKASRALDGMLLPAEFLDFRTVDLETGRLRPVARFVYGERPLESLRGAIAGLPDSTLDVWLERHDEGLSAWLRGAAPGGAEHAHVRAALSGGHLDIAEELNRAARWLLHRLGPDDLVAQLAPDAAASLLARPSAVQASHLRFSRLRFLGARLDAGLPFEDEGLDKVLLSLVLSYVHNPDETLAEVYRTIRPGGRVVVSTVRPDADASRLVDELVTRVKSDTRLAPTFGVSPEELASALQKYLSDAARIHELAEEGVFRFFAREELSAMLERAGFGQVKVHETFGRPALVYVAIGVKPQP
jgi:ubiquinone/menaquinone biosynthesis C-methylase UbiE